MRKRLQAFIQYFRTRIFKRNLLRYFDWPLFILIISISLFGVVAIFSATATGSISHMNLQ